METKELSSLIKALENVQESVIKKIGQDIPKSTIVVAREEKGFKHGHFTIMEMWQNEMEKRHEIFLSAESLQRGAIQTFGTLLHEMAHAYNHNNKIKDVSGDAYHNKKFKKTAEEIFGLKIEKRLGIGYSVTSVPKETQERWSEEIQVLKNALDIFALPTPKESRSRDKNLKKAMCDCGKCIRLSMETYEISRPKCQACDSMFQLVTK